MSHPAVLAFGVAVGLLLVWRWRRLEPTVKAGGALVAILAALIGVGVVPLPNVEAIVEEIGSTLGRWTYLFVAVMAFLETGAFVGLLAPGETVVIVGGVVAGQGRIDLLTLIGITWAAAVAGDVVSLMLGRKLGRGFLERHGHRVGITQERLEKVEYFFERYGGTTILIGRFLGIVRALAPFLAGASRMPLRRFLPYDIVAAGIWATTFCVLGFFFWRSLDQLTKWAGTGSIALGSVVTAVVVILFLRRLTQDPEFRRRVREWIARQPGGTRFLGVLDPVWDRASGPLRFVADRLTPGHLGLEVTTMLALGGVGAFAFVYLSGRGDGRLDETAFDVAEGIRSEPLTEFLTIFTDLGSSPVAGALILVTAIWAIRKDRTADALALIGGGLTVWVAVGIAKAGFGRERPPEGLITVDNFAYPSGHSAYAVALIACAVVLVRGGSRWATRSAALIVAILLASAVALSRVYLRAHYLTDVLGGLGLAFAVFALFGIAAAVIVHVRDNQRSQT